MDRDIWLLLVRILIVVSALLAVSGIVGCAIGHFIARGTHGPKPVPPAAPGRLSDRQRVATLAGRATRRPGPISRATPGAVSPFQRRGAVDPWLVGASDDLRMVDQVPTVQRMNGKNVMKFVRQRVS